MKTLLLILTVLAAITVARAAPLMTEVGVSYARISGLRSYAVPGLTQSDTSSLTLPFVRVSTALSDNWIVGVGYSYLGDLKGRGLATSSNIFGDPNVIGLAVITPFQSTEDIHEFSLDVRYAVKLADGLALQFGPVASLFHSKAVIATRTFTDTEAKIGAVADLRYSLTEHWQLALGCRYSQPTDREITQFYLSAGYRF